MQNYMAVAWLGFIIAIALAATVYMVGSLLMNEKIKLWAKMEIYEIVFSAVIVMLIFMLVPVATEITNAALSIGAGGQSVTSTYIKIPTPSGYSERFVNLCDEKNLFGYENIDACHIRLAVYYFRTIYDEGRIFGYNILRTYSWTSLLAELSFTTQLIHEKMGMIMFAPLKGFFTLRNQVLEFCFSWIVPLMAINKFQEILLKFLAVSAFPFIVVLGGLLRTFTFTRRLGGLLLAIALACYFIYPAVYALGGLLIIDIKNKARGAWVANTPANPYGSNDPPIIDTLYINKSDEIRIGNTKILEKYGDKDIEKEIARLVWEDIHEEQQRQEELRNGVDPGMDLGSKVDDSEKDGLLEKIATFINELVAFVVSRNFILDTTLWHDGGYIQVTARFAFFSILFSLFAIFGTIASIRSLAMTLGGDIELAGLTRLI